MIRRHKVPCLTTFQIVPPESSSLGHPREHAENLDADHMNMCKFTGIDDPNYRKFGAEMRDLYRHASQANENRTGRVLVPPIPCVYVTSSPQTFISKALTVSEQLNT